MPRLQLLLCWSGVYSDVKRSVATHWVTVLHSPYGCLPGGALETIRVVYIDKVSPRLLKIELNKTWAIFLQTRMINEPYFKTDPNVFQI